MRRLAAAGLLAVVSLVVHLTFASALERRGVFAYGDILFDTDISSRLMVFSEGHHIGIKHPNLVFFVTPPITLAAKALALIDPAGRDEAEVRRRLAVLLVPAVSALTTAIVMLLFCRLGLSLSQAFVATSLWIFSLSSL